MARERRGASRRHWRWAILGILVMTALADRAWAQVGIALTGVGPINRSMGGAATAAPLDAAGALNWNPASISGLPSSEMLLGMEFLLPTESISSRVDAGALGTGIPPANLGGTTFAEPGVTPIPTMAFVYKQPDSPWTYGLGMYGIAGFSINFPASTTNPILMPSPPTGIGLGRLSASLEVYQIAPTVAYALSDHVSVGFAPTIDMLRLTAYPLFLASPDDADGDGFASYPDGTGTRFHWGGGFQAGVFYTGDRGWNFGAMVKSPQWFEPIRFRSQNELGLPETATVNVGYPLIVSLGTAYTGLENYVFACDLRYFDYGNTEGFRASGFGPQGQVAGLGWNSVFALSAGVQRQLGDRLAVRFGYSFNQNPISDAETFFNVASPLLAQHAVYTGFSYRVGAAWLLSMFYAHIFQNQVEGPWHVPAGPVPGTSVTSQVSADTLGAGISVQF